ncbi:hypothetical protein [Campylobacter gastrosuis]|uniref:Lipoprotein n=1 Tax=Campylobacter gastrosuis TaxID=2974576 RepID=A0ABT7HSF1_9BACT|nr:hypothetical protein [Campylobacter gastrosuis]MDL0089849.1 hypothetical protein [Campylobacter gastrosuis]
MRFLALFLPIFLMGCAKQGVGKTEFVEVIKPVKCDAKIPAKPSYDINDLETAKALMIYHKQIELILKRCVNDK